MNWKPEETDIIDYLYGSMKAERKVEFETYLKENPSLQKEINDLRLTQKILPSFQDEEIIAPVSFTGENHIRSTSNRKWLYPISIAASIAIIFVTGYLTNFRMSFNENGFNVGFVEPKSDNNYLSEEQINKMIADKVNNYSTSVNKQLVTMQSGFNEQLMENRVLSEKQIRQVAGSSTNSTMDDAQVLQFIGQLQEENKKMMQNFYKVSAEEQQNYLRNILLEYSDYLEKQRQEDIQFIQASLLDIRSDSELKQVETDKILANIITTVNNQNSPINDRQSLD